MKAFCHGCLVLYWWWNMGSNLLFHVASSYKLCWVIVCTWYMQCIRRKVGLEHVQTGETQASLHRCAGWLDSFLFVLIVYGSRGILYTMNNGDQTAWIPETWLVIHAMRHCFRWFDSYYGMSWLSADLNPA